MPRPEAPDFFHHVDEAWQHPGRSHREQPEDGEADQVGQHQFVAEGSIDVGPAPPYPDGQRQGYDEDGVVVKVRGYVRQGVVTGQPVVEEALGRDAEPLFEGKNALPVVERPLDPYRRQVL